MTKQQIVDELARLYRLAEEGHNVQKAIQDLEEKLCEKMGCEDSEADD